MARTASKKRETKETAVSVRVNFDGTGEARIDTGVPFFDHMLTHLARHGAMDLDVHARGDLEIDSHHTVEDVGITLGLAFAEALGDGRGIRRFGGALSPMEDTLVQVALDCCGRSWLTYNVENTAEWVGGFQVELAEEFFQAFVRNAKVTLHINLQYGRNQHHILEAAFKGVALAFRQALEVIAPDGGIPSTKGVL